MPRSSSKPQRLFAKAFVKLQEPPVIDVEARPDGSVRILPGKFRVGTQAETGTTTGYTSVQLTESHMVVGTTSQSTTATTTSQALRLAGGRRLGPVTLTWEVNAVTMPPMGDLAKNVQPILDPMSPISRVDLGKIEFSNPRNFRQEVEEVVGRPPEVWGRLGGVFAANDPDDDSAGDTDRETYEDTDKAGDEMSDDDSDSAPIVREGIVLPFEAIGVRPPFSRK